MGKLYVNNGSWRTVKVIAVRDATQWRYVRSAWVKQGGIWRLFYGGNSGTETFASGSGSWTVPDGVFSVTLQACGGGGGGGSADAGSGYNGDGGGGGGSNIVATTISVTPGQTFSYSVGAGGAGAPGSYNSGNPGGSSTISGTAGSVTSDGGGGGTSGGNSGTGFGGIGGSGANYTSSFRVNAGGTSTNGGVSGGRGGIGSGAGGLAGENGFVKFIY